MANKCSEQEEQRNIYSAFFYLVFSFLTAFILNCTLTIIGEDLGVEMHHFLFITAYM